MMAGQDKVQCLSERKRKNVLLHEEMKSLKRQRDDGDLQHRLDVILTVASRVTQNAETYSSLASQIFGDSIFTRGRIYVWYRYSKKTVDILNGVERTQMCRSFHRLWWRIFQHASWQNRVYLFLYKIEWYSMTLFKGTFYTIFTQFSNSSHDGSRV